MIIKSKINPADHEVGVIIGRFQVNKLHDGHRNLINYVLDNHKKVIILLGVSRVQNTRKNPLDFASRKAMIQAEFPSVMILPIQDQRYNEKWSQQVDEKTPYLSVIK
jgi:bifunctional NMN adenylyltransferase/nudix hydrolase